jgi:preprotein translocase subunit SecD
MNTRLSARVNERGYMSTKVTWTACLVVFLSATFAQAQSQLSIRAASDMPIDGWQKMDVAHSNRVVWVAPTAAVTASDIESAQPEVRADGDLVINIVFTDDGVKKMHDLMAAQLKKTVALVVDDKVLWVPMVMYVVDTRFKENVLAGNTGHGLTQDEVDRIMAILRR